MSHHVSKISSPNTDKNQHRIFHAIRIISKLFKQLSVKCFLSNERRNKIQFKVMTLFFLQSLLQLLFPNACSNPNEAI